MSWAKDLILKQQEEDSELKEQLETAEADGDDELIETLTRQLDAMEEGQAAEWEAHNAWLEQWCRAVRSADKA